MDRAEAIELLKPFRNSMVDQYGCPISDVVFALDLADAESATTTDCISRQQAIEAIEGVDWYHVNPKGELVHGSTSDEESWYKADDIYKAIESLPPVAPKPVADCITRQQVTDEIKRWRGYLDEDMIERINTRMNMLPPVTPTEQNEEDILKFYYVESLDEYWIGQRCGTRYYGKWTGNCFTFGYSRYLPWGEHVVAPDTLWKEHTYPSEPKEIPFNEWLRGFLEKECQTERTGEWVRKQVTVDDIQFTGEECSNCNFWKNMGTWNYCPNCGAKMGGEGND